MHTTIPPSAKIPLPSAASNFSLIRTIEIYDVISIECDLGQFRSFAVGELKILWLVSLFPQIP
jgi:hypothetical protein